MENADMPLIADAVGGYHGRYMVKKGLSVDHSEIDSGYAENWSISHSHATASANISGLSNSGKFPSSSFKRSIDLETISECPDLKHLQETPTTRNIRHLTEFHINTPQNASQQLDTTPTKANYFSNLYDSSRSSHKKNSVRWSLNRSSPRLKYAATGQGRKSLSQTTLFESIDENYENMFTENGANVCNQSIGMSPIKPHNTSGSMNDEQKPKKVQILQRNPSGIESSTPKTNFRRNRTQSIVKAKVNLVDEMIRNRLVRKAQSFSPAKRLALREPNFQQSIDLEEVIAETEEPQSYNPARKVLEFNVQKFDQLLQMQPSQSSALQTPKKQKEVNTVTAKCDEPKTKQLPIRRLYTHKTRSRLVKEFSRKKSMKPTTTSMTNEATALKAQISIDASDILSPMADEQETDVDKCDNNLMETSDPAITTHKASNAISSAATPIRSNYIERDVREAVNRTPTKRFEKSTSYNFLSVKSSPQKEKFNIVYGHLPCTPPKNYPRRQLKRPASSAHTESPCLKAPSAKRKLYNTDCERQMYCNGIEKFDILTHLNNSTSLIHITEKILGYIPDEGLQAVHSVCKSWRALIDRNRKFSARRRKYVKKMQMIKENVYKNEIKPIISNNNINHNNNNNINIKAFHEHNGNLSVEQKTTVVVSPSRRRFEEHQNIVRSLKPEQRVINCPQCNGASIVYPATGTEAKIYRRSPRTKNRINLIKVIVSEYAVCSKKTCGIEFCTNCCGNRHLNTKCTKRPLGSSPKSDDDLPLHQPEYRTTKRHRRLGRLVF